MKLDTSHAHSEESITAINNSLNNFLSERIVSRSIPSLTSEILHLLLTEWADDKDLIDIAKFLKERLDT
jgi:hypothetical protein|tara:strand:- start:978 stop:1184 length:207 start_codon:yes stop_codon:yes gene_type:complete